MKDLIDGAFEFRLDDVGTLLTWDSLDESLKAELTKDNEFNEENSKIYRCGLAAFENFSCSDARNQWGQVRRICVEAKTGSPKMAIFGISPRDKKVSDIPQSEMGFVASLQGGAKLFDVLKMKLSLDYKTKSLSREDRYAVLSTFVKRYAQWVYSTGWDKKNLDMFVYVAVPNSLNENKRVLHITVHALRKKNRIINSTSLVSEVVSLPS